MIKLIIRKYLEGTTTPVEEQKLEEWLMASEDHVKLYREEVTRYERIQIDEAFDHSDAFEAFKKDIVTPDIETSKDISYIRYYKYAAAIVVLCVATYFLKQFFVQTDAEQIYKEVITDVSTTKNQEDQIVLTLNDGTQKVVNKERKELSYVNVVASTVPEVTLYHEIKVPKGELFKLILSDSTVVWLNAETTLKFPKIFLDTKATRTVVLEGEAFFEVTHREKQPFIVESNEMEVKVLGTKFNVSSYAEEPNVNTTLVEGAVQVSDVAHQDSIRIQPNFQASFDKKTMSLKAKSVNVSEYISWMDQKITFRKMSFKQLIHKIERRYNVEIHNVDESLNKEELTGEFDTENIATVFKSLAASLHFEYEIKDNIITIKKN